MEKSENHLQDKKLLEGYTKSINQIRKKIEDSQNYRRQLEKVSQLMLEHSKKRTEIIAELADTSKDRHLINMSNSVKDRSVIGNRRITEIVDHIKVTLRDELEMMETEIKDLDKKRKELDI